MNRVTLIGNVGQDARIIRLGENKEMESTSTAAAAQESIEGSSSASVSSTSESERRENNVTELARFDLATTQVYRNRSGEIVRGAEWHHIAIYNPVLRDFATKFVKKGAKVYVEGRLRYRRFTDDKDNERTITEVVLGRDGNLQILSRVESEGEME